MIYPSTKLWSSLFLITLLLLIGCDKNTVINEHKDIKDGLWSIDSLVSFDFNIQNPDTTYQVSYDVRYAIGYPYYNLYIKYYLDDPTGKTISSDMQELMLFDRKDGKPLGDGLGDLFDYTLPVFGQQTFPLAGKYTFSVQQFMRKDTLPGIYSFGIQVRVTE